MSVFLRAFVCIFVCVHEHSMLMPAACLSQAFMQTGVLVYIAQGCHTHRSHCNGKFGAVSVGAFFQQRLFRHL